MADRRIAKYREEARANQDGKCYYCTHPMTDADSGEQSATTADHLIPVARGGRSTRANIVASCYRCNQKKDCDPSFMPKLSKHARNRRREPAAIDRQQRKSGERMRMWREQRVHG